MKMRTEKELDFLEEHIPNLANSAIQKAYLDALSGGQSVVEAIDGELFEIFPDGHKVFIKNIAEDIPVETNKKIYIK